MRTTSSPALTHPQSLGQKLRNAGVGMLFALVLLIPRVLHLRRNARSWRLFCILLGVAGASLVILPLGLGNNYAYALIGMALFIGAILLPPAKPVFNADDKARELGALVVVNGGQYQSGDVAGSSVRIFVGAESIAVLDSRFQPLLMIPVSKITSARAEKSGDLWLVRVAWPESTAEFSYSGMFAEHFARVAEGTVQSVMRPSLTVIPQARAASA